jgi:hypothetical protein
VTPVIVQCPDTAKIPWKSARESSPPEKGPWGVLIVLLLVKLKLSLPTTKIAIGSRTSFTDF